MNLHNVLTKDSLVEIINNICGTDNNRFTFQEKASKINQALDWYFRLAFKADGRFNFDDINHTSAPIDTQNLVSGTNSYKIGSFTQKIHQVLRVEILSDAAKGVDLIPERLDNLNVDAPGNASGRISGYSANSFQQLYLDASSGTPTHYCKYGDYIYLRPKPNYNETNGLKIYFNRPASKYTFARYTQTVANPSVFTSTAAHGLAVNDTVVLATTGALLTGFSVDTNYYVATAPSTTTFTLASTRGGSGIEGSGSQSGEHAFLQVNVAPGITDIHHPIIARKAALLYLIEMKKPQVANIAQLVIDDEREVKEHYARRDRDIRPKLNVLVEDNR